MTLIASISGIRGTLGGITGSNLTPVDIVEFASAYGMWLTTRGASRTVVLGRDARPSGTMLESLVAATLAGLGFEVINLGLSTTPTVEMAVPHFQAAGGIVLTASHNPVQWNALKLLNHRGEFVTKKDGLEILDILQHRLFSFAPTEDIGRIRQEDFLDTHIQQILALPMVDTFAIAKAGFRVAVDAVNSSGGIAVPRLLRALGLHEIVEINCTPDGNFAHNPEPLKEHLTDTLAQVRAAGAHIGFVVDPDVDRLAVIDENGEMFGEEYTLVAVADYILSLNPGAVVNNLSSSRALRDVAARYGCTCYSAAVGEVNVTEKMKRHDAVIGGEGNGGIILPDLHYGRDALVGIALFLSLMAKRKLSCSALRATYPAYYMSKQKADLSPGVDVDAILKQIEAETPADQVNTVDGLKIDLENSWAHLRKSNTEPIVRIYTEAPSQAEADALAARYKDQILQLGLA